MMKKLFIISSVALAALTTGCNDLLDKSPLDTFTNTPTYWSNASNVENQCNTFYNSYSGYGNAGSGGWFYFKTLSDDQIDYQNNQWTNTNVPSASTNWSSPFEEIRRANYILEGLKTSSLSESEIANFEGIARLNRAWQYYQLVRMYGNVPWVETVLDPTDEAVLYGPRTDRDEVMDKVLEDLDYAALHITGTNKQRFTADMALAMKADVTLYEGTYCKYRTADDNAGKGPDATRAKKYLEECVKACEALMAKGYTLNADYKGNYNSINLATNPEMIFYKPYSENVLMHSTIDYTVNTGGTSGMTKNAFEAYLFLDGKPLATTTLDKSDVADRRQKGVDDGGKPVYYYNIEALLAVRDKRLAATIDTVLTFKGSPYSRAGVAEFTSTTGYGVAKYDNWDDISVTDRNNIGKQYTDCPLYWLSVVYLDFAEAKAELGTLSQSDLDNSINKLQARAGLPGLTTSPDADPANNMGVSNLLWEIRRCRRCELMFDNWVRYWDLVRWHKLDLLDSQKNPDIYLGANMSNVVEPEVDVAANGYMQGSNTLAQPRAYDKKYYFYPIPSGQLTLNPNLEPQNPGW